MGTQVMEELRKHTGESEVTHSLVAAPATTPRLVEAKTRPGGSWSPEEVQGLPGRLPRQREGKENPLTANPPLFAANTELVKESLHALSPKIQSRAGDGCGMAARTNRPRIYIHIINTVSVLPKPLKKKKQ